MTIIGKPVTSPLHGPFSGPGEVRPAREKSETQQVQPVERIKSHRRDQNHAPKQAPFTAKEFAEDRRTAGGNPRGTAPAKDTAETKGHGSDAGRESGFVAQLLVQDSATPQNAGKAQRAEIVRQHPQGAALGSEVYRLAGAEPSLLSKDATFISIAV